MPSRAFYTSSAGQPGTHFLLVWYQFANDRCLNQGCHRLMENDLEQSATMGHGMRVRDGPHVESGHSAFAPNSLEPSYYIPNWGQAGFPTS